MTHARTFAFGPYTYTPRRQTLLRNGEVVRVGCRALDLLTAFVQRPGELLSKRELMAEAWPSTTVVEGNLKVHIAALRRALDDDADLARYIATVNGRGYRFIAPVETCHQVGEVDRAPVEPLESRFQEVVALLTQAMRSVIIDLPTGAESGVAPATPRRVLCIELAARDEPWIEHLFARPQRMISATL